MKQKKSDQIWRAFENGAYLERTTAEWKQSLGSDFNSVKQYLRSCQGLATSIPCGAKPECGCIHAVVEHARDNLVSVCRCSPKRCETTSINRTDAVVYELDSAAFGSAIAQALESKPEGKPIDDLHATWQIGTYSPQVGVGIPLFLTVQSDPDQIRQVAERLLVANERPFVLFSPTDTHWKPEYDRLFRDKKAVFIPLSEIITWNGTISAKRKIGDIISHIVSAVLPPSKDKCVLKKDGATWTVIFQDVTKTVRHSKGVDYIACLLRNPGQDVFVSMLRAATVGEDGSVILGSAGSTLDQKAINDYKERIEEIEEDLKMADGDRKATLLQDRATLYAEIGRATGLRGRKRNQRDDLERARQSVSRAIHTFLKTIKSIHPSFHQHLENSVKIGVVLSYRPSETLVWAAE